MYVCYHVSGEINLCSTT